MDLIDRYLATVRLFLPRAERDDIVAELRDLLLSRSEEKEADLGRALNRKEQEALLKDFGHPLAVAARYGRQQYLIGPDLYPIYAFVLALVLGALGLSAAITGLVETGLSGDPLHGLREAARIILSGVWVAIGAVTFVFAGLQRSGAGRRILEQWSFADLPNLPKRRQRRRSWYEPVAGVVFHAIFVLWWVGILRYAPPAIPVEHGALHLAFAPALNDLYLPVLALAAGTIAVNLTELAGPDARRVAFMLDMVRQAGLAAVAGLALHAGHWTVVTGTGVAPATLANVGQGVEIGAHVTLIVLICIGVAHFFYDAWRAFRPEPQGRPEGRPATNGA